jgi:hypothetical protein
VSESLKAQRERVATEICTATPPPCPACLKDLRELQRAAMVKLLEHEGYDAEGMTRVLDELLDEEPKS